MFNAGVQKIKLSKKFQDTCVRIGECKSRESEEQIVSQWMSSVKTELAKPTLSESSLYENVVSLIHLTLLGYNTSFGHIQAVNLTQKSQMQTKALGYLACAALLDSKSDLLILIINSTQRDLSSGQSTSMSLALTSICNLITPDLIPTILAYVGQALTHSIPLIRQKAVMCIHSFIQKDPTAVVEFFPELVRLLGDNDLSVVNAVVNTFETLLINQLNARQICDCLPEIGSICSMIQEGRIKSEYVHQRILAPFVLVNLFRLFERMAPHLPEMGKDVSPILTFALNNCKVGCSASACVLYEAIRACIALQVLDIPQLRPAISLFMNSHDPNLQFVGLGLLQSLPDYADEFQTAIIDSLEHPDSTIRLRTLGLLHAMANENNAQIIVINMLKFFQRTRNERIRTELADRITTIASQYSPSPLWFAKTMEQLFALGGDHVRPDVAFAVLRLIEENCDEETQRGIVNLYIDVAQSGRRLSDVFIIVIAKIIGLYAQLSDEYDLDFIALLLCDLADAYVGPRDWVLNALLQIIGKLDDVPHQVTEVFEHYKQSRSIIVQEICFEGIGLLRHRATLANAVEPLDGEPDEQLGFLDDLVAVALKRGQKAYIDISVREGDLAAAASKTKTLKVSYDAPQTPQVYGVVPAPEPVDESRLRLENVSIVWGLTGLQGEGSGGSAGLPTPVEEDKPEPPSSAFAKFSRKQSALTGDDARRADLAGKVFRKQATAAAALAARKAAAIPKAMAAASPYGPARVTLTEEDYQLIDDVLAEIAAPMPDAIRALTASATGAPIFEDGPIKISATAGSGTVLVGIINVGDQPVLGLKVSVIGPDVLIKEAVSHPATLRAVPAQQAVWLLTQFKFPQQASFPEFKFTAIVQYGGVKPISIALPNVNLGTFIVPADANTQQFSQFWRAGGKEEVYSFPKSAGISLDDLSQALNELLHVKTVERIGSEEIFIGNLYSTPFKILVHVKVGAQKTDVKVLTKVPPLTQGIISLLKGILG